MTSRRERKARRDASAAGLLAEVRANPAPVERPAPVYWRPRWERPSPDAYAELLREALAEAEANDDGRSPDPWFATGYAAGLRVATELHQLPITADDFAELLRAATLDAERHDDGTNRFSAGSAMGLRVAAALYGMDEGQDPITRARMREEELQREQG